MKILITGGNGFVARNLSEQLKKEYVLYTPCSKELNLLDTVRVYNYIKDNCFDVVIHTATYDAAPKTSTKDPSKVLENNLRMFFNITRCNKYFSKMIYFGSGAEFGRENWKHMMDENYFDVNVPADQYGFSKYLMTKYTLENKNIYNLRLFGVFGKYEDWRYRFISNACCYAVLGMPVIIRQNVFFDYLYIDDLVRIVEWFINSTPVKNVYNVCSGKSYDLKTLAEKVIKISKKNLEIIIRNEGLGREYSGSNSTLLTEMKNFKLTPVDKSIEALYNWYASNRHIINEDEFFYT